MGLLRCRTIAAFAASSSDRCAQRFDGRGRAPAASDPPVEGGVALGSSAV